MKIILTTQHRENYAAHEGFRGEYHWKYKGGDIYIIEGVTVRQAQDKGFWEYLSQQITSFDNYFEEYVVGEELVDDDIPNTEFHQEWEAPIVMTMSREGLMAERTETDWQGTRLGVKRWIQRNGTRECQEVEWD